MNYIKIAIAKLIVFIYTLFYRILNKGKHPIKYTL